MLENGVDSGERWGGMDRVWTRDATKQMATGGLNEPIRPQLNPSLM